MYGQHSRQARLTLLAIPLAISILTTSWIGAAAAQAPAGSEQTIEQLHGRLDAMQRELEHLRAQVADTNADSALAVAPDALLGYPVANRQPAELPGESSYTYPGCDEACDVASNHCGCDACGGCGCGGCGCRSCPAPCVDCPRITTKNPYFNVFVFGALKLDMLLSDARAVAPGTPYFLLPGSVGGLDQNTTSVHARQSQIGAALAGPRLGNFQTGGMLLFFFYNDNALADAYGLLPSQIWGELKNENWRFAAGYQNDLFNPGIPTMLTFSALCGSGNSGDSWRGQVRIERYLHTVSDAQWTLQFALSDPITTAFDPGFALSEDNGWPNLEGRVAYGLGDVDPAGRRLFEVGMSGVVGQVRNTRLNANNVTVERFVTDVWGMGADFRWRFCEAFGVMGEIYTGQSLGTYNGAVQQITYTENDYAGIRSTGGWGEFYVYWDPCLHSHFGYGLDDPRNSDISPQTVLGRTFNSTVYGNVIWDVTEAFRVAFEVSQRNTDYRNALIPDNSGMGFHTQFTWSF